MQRIRTLMLLALILSFSTGGFAMIDTLPLEEVVIQSEVIAIATLKTAEKMPKDKEGLVKIHNTVTLSLIMKGEAKTGEDLVIDTIEGIEDEPVFEARKRYVLFLQKIPNGTTWRTTNLVQGFWTLGDDEKYLGMGLGTTKAQLEQAIQKTKGQKPKPFVPPQPAF